MGHVGAKMAMLGSFLGGLGGFFGRFLEQIGRCAGYQKTLKNHRFFKVFKGVWVESWAHKRAPTYTQDPAKVGPTLDQKLNAVLDCFS